MTNPGCVVAALSAGDRGSFNVRWTPVFGRVDKVELCGWEAPYQGQVDGREESSIWCGLQGKVAVAATKSDRTMAQLARQFRIATSRVTAWKKPLTQVAELFADGRQRRADQAADGQELDKQIGRLKMEVK